MKTNKTLPAGWMKVRLGEVGKIVTGTTPSTEKSQYYENGIYPFVTPTDISSHRVISKTGRYLTSEGMSKGRLISKGSLLVTCIASIGKNAILDSEGSCNQQINAITPNKNYNVMYLYYLMENNFLYLTKFAGKSATAIINKKSFSNLEFIVPPLSEQKASASLLETWDTVIEKTEALIAAKEKRFKWLQHKLIGDGSRKTTLSEFVDIAKKDKITTVEGTKLLTVKLHCKGIQKNTRDMKITLSAKGRPYYARNAGEFLIGRQNFHNGGFGIVPLDLDGFIASNAITSLNINEKKLDPEFLFYYFSRKDYYSYIAHIMDGTGQKELSDKQIMKLPISVPSMEEQVRIVAILNITRKEIDLLKKLAESYRTQKRGLMQKLLVGWWCFKPENDYRLAVQ